MKQLLLALGVAAFLVGAAQAASPELKVTQSVEIAAPPAKVWGIIKNFEDLTWHPAIKASSATDGSKVGSVRTLDLGGPKLVERLTKATRRNRRIDLMVFAQTCRYGDS
jgi:hypothetical protein